MFGMTLLLKKPTHERAGCAANLLAPVNEALRSPFEMGAVCRRHVLDDGGVASHAIVAGMAGHTATAMQQLDSARCDARIKLESNKRVRNAVAMFIDLDVVVDVERHCL